MLLSIHFTEVKVEVEKNETTQVSNLLLNNLFKFDFSDIDYLWL